MEENAKKELNRKGKAWFVSYKFYQEEDKNEVHWKNCQTVQMRINVFRRTRQYHMEWLEYIIFADENKLGTNELGFLGSDITVMACIIYDKLNAHVADENDLE